MCRRWTAEDKRADGGDGTVEGAHGCVGGGLPEWTAVTVLKKVTEVTVVETLWPLPLLLSVSVEADWWRQTDRTWLTAPDVTEVSTDRGDGCVGGGLPEAKEVTDVTEVLRELTNVSEEDCQR